MFNIQIDASQIEKLSQKIGTADVKKILHSGLLKSITLAEREAKIESPIRTGRLRKEFKTEVKGLQAILTNTVEYFPMVHQGTKPYAIAPKNKKALYWKGGHNPVTKVRHPGIKANPIFARVLEKIENKIAPIMNDEIGKFLQTLSVS